MDPSAIVTHLSVGGLSGAFKLLTSNTEKKSNFEDTYTDTVIIVIVVIIIIIYILLLIAMYKLTDSGLQTLLFFLFGFLYLMIVLIYYGFSGYKIIKRSKI